MPLFLVAALALQMTEPPTPSLDEASETYVAPPANAVTAPSFETGTLGDAGAFQLAAALNAVDSSLSSCIKMREDISTLIMGDKGSYAVHPDWVPKYQSCILERDREITALGRAIHDRKPILLSGLEGDSAYRVTNIIARLEVYQTRLKGEVSAEIAKQKDLVSLYNKGGSLETGPRTVVIPAEIPPAESEAGQ